MPHLALFVAQMLALPVAHINGCSSCPCVGVYLFISVIVNQFDQNLLSWLNCYWTVLVILTGFGSVWLVRTAAKAQRVRASIGSTGCNSTWAVFYIVYLLFTLIPKLVYFCYLYWGPWLDRLLVNDKAATHTSVTFLVCLFWLSANARHLFVTLGSCITLSWRMQLYWFGNIGLEQTVFVNCRTLLDGSNRISQQAPSRNKTCRLGNTRREPAIHLCGPLGYRWFFINHYNCQLAFDDWTRKQPRSE